MRQKFPFHFSGRDVVFDCLLLFAGLVLWGIFLNWGYFSYFFMDWAEVNMPRLAFVRHALQLNQLPLFSAGEDILRCKCDMYFSVPDAITTPLLVLLKWIDIRPWILLDTWVLFAAGFWGLARLRRRFRLSPGLYLIAYVLIFFNGHILSHMAVGHLTWGGYFLFPWLVLLMDQFVQGDNSWGWTLKMALLYLAIFLQGSFHQFVWSLIFLGLCALVFYRRFWVVVRTGLAIGLVSAFRLLPPILALDGFPREFYGGYPNLMAIYQSLTDWVPPSEAMPFRQLGSNLGYWEFDLYIGKLGFWLLLLAGLAWLAWQIRQRKPDWILLPLAGLTLLAFEDVFQLVLILPLPLLAGERVASRMISLPFVFCVVLALAAVQNWSEQLGPLRRVAGLAFLAAGLGLFYNQTRYLLAWSVEEGQNAFPFVYTYLEGRLPASRPDPLYFGLLLGGALISLLSIIGLVYLQRRSRQTQGSPAPIRPFPEGAERRASAPNH